MFLLFVQDKFLSARFKSMNKETDSRGNSAHVPKQSGKKVSLIDKVTIVLRGSCALTTKHVSIHFLTLDKVPTTFYRLCCKEIVKEDINTDYDTYGHEGEVDYVTNQNPYYEHNYDDMEIATGQKGRPYARVRALSQVEVF